MKAFRDVFSIIKINTSVSLCQLLMTAFFITYEYFCCKILIFSDIYVIIKYYKSQFNIQLIYKKGCNNG